MKTSLKAVGLGVLATATISFGVITTPANAASQLTVTISKTSELSQGGETVAISISNIPTNQGVYVYQCASDSASPRPASAVCRIAMSDSLWVSTSAISQSQGATDASLSQNFSLTKAFTNSGTTYDCMLTSCGIFIRRDHLGGGDFSLDVIYPITFKANPVAAAPSVAAPSVVGIPENSKTISDKLNFGLREKSLSKANKKKLKTDLPSYAAASQIVITATVSRSAGTSSKTNKKIARQRASMIKKYLVANGVAPSKIVIKTKNAKSGTKPSVKVVASS